MKGYFSEKASKLHGTVYYFGLSGRELEVTEALPDGVPSKWDDAKPVGTVLVFSRQGKPPVATDMEILEGAVLDHLPSPPPIPDFGPAYSFLGKKKRLFA